MSVIQDLRGRVCLVTGGSRGIGRAIVLALAEAGGDVAINNRERVDDALAVAAKIRALGAKCAAPNRKVVCYSGDGALYYHLTELETAKRRGIAVTLIVNNNSGFGQGWPNLVRSYGNKPGDPAEMLRFGPTSFADIARGFGIRSIRVEDPTQIGAALRQAIAADETVVVDVATDIEARAPEPWLPATG